MKINAIPLVRHMAKVTVRDVDWSPAVLGPSGHEPTPALAFAELEQSSAERGGWVSILVLST